MTMKLRHKNSIGYTAALTAAGLLIWSCGSNTSSDTAPTATASEVAVTAVSGSVNAGDTSVAMNDTAPSHRCSDFAFIPSAYADILWDCQLPTITENGSTVTSYQGPGTYSYTPASCSVTYDNSLSASSSWSGSWTLTYNSSCSVTGAIGDFKIGKQADNCLLSRTAPTGITRTITGPDGNTYAVTHNTDGSGTGYNTAVSTNNNGVLFECTSGGNPCTGGTITINGSHLTATYNSLTYWDHTVTTGTASSNSPLTVTVSGSGVTQTKTISGSVTVQHNLLKTTSVSTFSNVTYNKADCCFPVSGSISTTYSGGSLDGKTESFSFDGSSCGVGTVTKTDGTTATVTMIHCI